METTKIRYTIDIEVEYDEEMRDETDVRDWLKNYVSFEEMPAYEKRDIIIRKFSVDGETIY